MKNLKKKNYIIYIISKNVKKNKIDNLNFLKIDITKKKDREKLKSLKFNYIVNFGGYINHAEFDHIDATDILNVHFFSFINLLSEINLSNIKHIIQIGSSDEYGFAKSPQSEKSSEIPFSPYGLSKKFLSDYLISYYKQKKIPITIVRLFLVYGPGQKKNRMIPQVICNSLNKKSFPVSLGNQIRDFCYIDDVTEALSLILGNKKTFGEILNVASGKPIKIKEVIKLINKKIGTGKPIFGKLRSKKENKSLYANINKIQKLTNWKPKTNLEEGLKKTIKFYEK